MKLHTLADVGDSRAFDDGSFTTVLGSLLTGLKIKLLKFMEQIY